MAVGESLGKDTIMVRRARAHAGAVIVDAKTEARLLNRVLLIALGLGGCVDIFFYNKDTGISVLVFVTLVVAALVIMALAERVRVVWRNSWLFRYSFSLAWQQCTPTRS